ncbi:MAG TPA: hypothetical protein VIU63_09285, partial [Nitrospira sp.]
EDPRRFDFDRPQRLLKEWAARNGIETIDVLPEFREVARQKPLFYDTDLHMTTAGHRLVADMIWPTLSSLKDPA